VAYGDTILDLTPATVRPSADRSRFLRPFMANQFTQFSVLFPVSSAGNIAPALALYHHREGPDQPGHEIDHDHVAVAQVEPDL
jgi:hypothetical protein